MAQVTLRVPDELAHALKTEASRQGKSLNSWASMVLESAVNPDLVGDDVERVRERLRRAGLLLETEPRRLQRPDPDTVARARREAGRGKPLSDIVAEGRGPR